jgi:hypothetical protein
MIEETRAVGTMASLDPCKSSSTYHWAESKRVGPELIAGNRGHEESTARSGENARYYADKKEGATDAHKRWERREDGSEMKREGGQSQGDTG